MVGTVGRARGSSGGGGEDSRGNSGVCPIVDDKGSGGPTSGTSPLVLSVLLDPPIILGSLDTFSEATFVIAADFVPPDRDQVPVRENQPLELTF